MDGLKDERPTSNVRVSEDSDIERKETSTLGILGTLAHFRHFPTLSGLGIAVNNKGIKKNPI